MHSPKMKAVMRSPRQYGRHTQEQCQNCNPEWGGLGFCRKHTPYHTIENMGFCRWLWVWIVKGGKILVVSVLPIIVKVVVLVMFVLLFALITNSGLEKQELVTCNKLAQQAQTHKPYFYLTETEKSMCDDLDVVIQAPVK